MVLSENGVFSRDVPLPNPSLVRDSQIPLSETPPQSYGGQNTAAGESKAESSVSVGGLDPKDIVILVKTGATSIWRRMPAHMSTTLSNHALTPNIIYYSDSPDNINGNPVIDVLANVSASLKSSPDFTLYNRAKEIDDDNLYLESGSMEGDFYLPGGWRLDKYKFVPMFQHVATYMPGKKWYIYMEVSKSSLILAESPYSGQPLLSLSYKLTQSQDDNYYFWTQLYSWLATLDHTKPLMIGSPAFRLGEDFAHGGSGFAITGKALEISFGSDKSLADKFEEYAREQCCGDQVLSHVLHEKGVERFKDLDGTGWAALQSLPTWRIGFGSWNWCSPIVKPLFLYLLFE